MSIAQLVPYYTAAPAPMTKAKAVRAIVKGHMARGVAHGHGNKAGRREALARMPREELRETDVDALAEEHAEARRPHYLDLPIAQNFHD